MNVLSFIRKIMSVSLILGLILVMVACNDEGNGDPDPDMPNDNDDESVTNEDDTDEDDTDEDDTDQGDETFDSHYDRLSSEGKTVNATGLTYNESTQELDYSDDHRTVADTSTLSDDDVIDIPSDALRDFLATQYAIETPITYKDVRSIERITFSPHGVESLAGIEYFTSLKNLDVGFNPGLTSIKGVEALNDLDTLDISHTAVKTIDYAMPSLTRLDAVGTFVELDEESLAATVASLPSLNYLDLSKTSFKVTDAVLNEVDTMHETQSFQIGIDYKQLDFQDVGYDAFFEFDEDGKFLQYKNPGIDCNIIQSEDSEMDSIESLYVDVKDASYNDTLVDAFADLHSAIGVDQVDHSLEKIILIYDYFSEHIVVEDTGSHSVLDAYGEKPVTEATKFEAMALFYQHLNLEVFSKQLSYSFFSEEEANGEVYFLDVIYEDNHYAIGDYDHFMVGSENIKPFIETSLRDQDLEVDDALVSNVSKSHYPQHDFRRDLLRQSAQNLNIELIFYDEQE